MQRRRFRLLVIYAILLLPTIILQAAQALQGASNSPLEWVSVNDPMRQRYDAFVDRFGSGDVVVASWSGCDFRSPQLDALAATLRSDTAFFDGSIWLFDRVTTGREPIMQMVQSGISLEESLRRLRGTVIGPDGSTTCIIVGFTKKAVEQRARLVPRIQQAIQDHFGVLPADQHLAGPIVDGLSVDTASQETLQTAAPRSSLIVLLAALLCLGSWLDAVIVFAVAVYCQAITLALVSLAGDSISALLVVLPPLIQVLALAGGIHLVNYYRQSAAHLSPSDAASRAVQVGLLPCILSAATTAIGMASLMASQLTPIRSFGAFSTAGILITTVVFLCLVPAMLARGHVRQRNGKSARTRSRPSRVWNVLTSVITFARLPISLAFAGAMVAACAGISQLHTSVRIETLFPPDSRILSDYDWLETNVRPLVPIEILLDFAQDRRPHREQLMIASYVDDQIASRREVGGTISAATFMPPIVDASSDGSSKGMRQAREKADATVAAALPGLTQMRMVASTSTGGRQWRIQAFVSAGGKLDYAKFLPEIERDLSAMLVDQDGQAFSDVKITTTGIMPLVHRIQHQLMNDLQHSFLLAFAIILVVMTVLQGSILAGIVAMIPNVFPTLLLFGVLGWMEVAIDIGSVMTASVALGVAVDDTLHFLTAFQRELKPGCDRRSAVLAAFQHCGLAMLQTSVICAAGMAVFAVSDFLPTARFAWMMVGLFAAAIVGDLILLPALLIGPLGALFEQPPFIEPTKKSEAPSRPPTAQGDDLASSTRRRLRHRQSACGLWPESYGCLARNAKPTAPGVIGSCWTQLAPTWRITPSCG